MDRPREGLIRFSRRLEQALRKEHHERGQEVRDLKLSFGCARTALEQDLGSLQQRIGNLEKKLENRIDDEKQEREIDVHELRHLLKHEIMAREGLFGSMHEVFMSKFKDHGGEWLPKAGVVEQNDEEEADPAAGFPQQLAFTKMKNPPGLSVHFQAEDFPHDITDDVLDLTRSASEQHLTALEGQLGKLEDDVLDLRRLLSMERTMRMEQIRSLEEQFMTQLEERLAVLSELFVQEAAKALEGAAAPLSRTEPEKRIAAVWASCACKLLERRRKQSWGRLPSVRDCRLAVANCRFKSYEGSAPALWPGCQLPVPPSEPVC